MSPKGEVSDNRYQPTRAARDDDSFVNACKDRRFNPPLHPLILFFTEKISGILRKPEPRKSSLFAEGTNSGLTGEIFSPPLTDETGQVSMVAEGLVTVRHQQI